MSGHIPVSQEAYQISVIHDYLIEMFVQKKIDETTFRVLLGKVHQFTFEGNVE
jgi:hypothetical protein